MSSFVKDLQVNVEYTKKIDNAFIETIVRGKIEGTLSKFHCVDPRRLGTHHIAEDNHRQHRQNHYLPRFPIHS
jgi:hypothetical protein